MNLPPPSEGFKILKGDFDLFAFFQSQEARDKVMQALQYFRHNAKRHDSPLPISRWVLRGFYDKDFNREEEVSHFYVHPNQQERSDFPSVNYEYLRLLIGSQIQDVVPVSNLVLRVKGRVEYPLTVNPVIRFMTQFKEYIGILSRNVEFYTASGAVYPWYRGISGLKKIEPVLIDLFSGVEEPPGEVLELTSLVMDLMETSRFYKRDRILAGIVKSDFPFKMRKRAVEMVINPKHLVPIYLDLEPAIKKEVRYRLEDDQLEMLEGIPKSEAHPEYPPIDIDTIKEKLREIFSEEPNLEKFTTRLANAMYRVRENKYSPRCRAPEGYVAVVTYSVPGPRGRMTIVLPGQPPVEERPVITEQQTKELLPLGSLFVVWISKKEIEKRPKFYRSKKKVLFHISIPH